MGISYMKKSDFSLSQRFLSKAIDVINNLLKNSKGFVSLYLSGEFML